MQPELRDVLHRSQNCIVLKGQSKLFPREKDQFSKFGWNAPVDKPYQPLGEFMNVVPVIEEVKQFCSNCSELDPDTQKLINKIKRSNNPLFRPGYEPIRVMRIFKPFKNSKDTKAKTQSFKKAQQQNIEEFLSKPFIDLKKMA